MPAAAEADGVRAAGAGFLQLTDEQARALISSQPIHQLYDVEEEPFARGKYAAVRRCRATGAAQGAPWRFAAKYLRKWRRAADLRPEILHEVAILHACRRSARVVKLFGVFESDQEMVLLLELAEGGELQTLLDRDIVPDEAQVRHLMRQILLGLRDLHDLNVAHLDIKPQNLVLTGEFPNGDVKLCDLGISRYVGEGADVRDMLGTPDYVAPEVLNYEPISLATDMWSVGVLVYVLLTGCSPFGGDTKQETFCNISQCNLDFPEDLFEDISEEAKDLMRKLMVKEPSKRLTVEQSLLHSWFSVTQVPTIGTVREASSEICKRNSFREADRISPVVAGKLEKSSPALSKKLDRPSPTMMRKPGKEVPELIKNNDLPHDIPKRTVPVTRDAPSRSETTPSPSKQIIAPTPVSIDEVNSSKELQEDADGNTSERSACGMRSFRKSTFKKNMGSILERVTSCEDFENNNGFSGSNDKNSNSNNSGLNKCSENSSSNSNNSSNSNSSDNSSNSNCNGNSVTSSNSRSSNISANNNNNEISSSNIFGSSNKNISNEKITHVSSISISTSDSNSTGSSTTSNITSNSCTSSSGNSFSSSVCPSKNIAMNRAVFETSKVSTRFSSSAKKIPAPETPAANSNASMASLIMPRPNRATAMQTMPLGGVREFRLKFEQPSSSSTATKVVTTSTSVRHNSMCTLGKTVTTSTLTTTTSSSSSSPSTAASTVSVVVTSTTPTSSLRGGSQKCEENDCVYTFRKCFIIDDGENENVNSLVSDGTNESEASSGYYDNSSCCSSSDSVSDVSETSADSGADRLSTASMDSLDSCYGKEKRHYSSTLATFSLKNNYNKRISSLKSETNSKTHQSPAFHLAVSTFNRISENTSKALSQMEELEQEKIFAAARRQAAKASHTTVINKVVRAPFAVPLPPNPLVHKVCALNITRERNGNEVVLQEVKAGKCNRFSEVKIESVQSRIKKFQS